MIKLLTPNIDLAQSYFDLVEERRTLGEKIWDESTALLGESALVFVERLNNAEFKPLPNRVPEATYWAVIEAQVVGRISLRHCLNQNLEEFGGHIGYEIRPSFRKRGIATAMLRQLLLTAKAKEIGKLLLTCAPDNVASNKTILKNGGVLKKTVFLERIQRDTSYYWIDLNK